MTEERWGPTTGNRHHDGRDTDGSTTRPQDGRHMPSVSERAASVVRAGHDGEVATVRSGLGDPAPTVRAVAVSAALRLAGTAGATPSATTAAVLAGLHDEDPSVRRRAASVAARWVTVLDSSGERAVSDTDVDAIAADLIDLLGDDDARVCEVSAFACGELPLTELHVSRSRVVGALSAVADAHDDALCRESAVAALGAVGDPAALDVVLGACSDRANVRRRAVLALAAFDHPAATAELRRLTGDRDLQVRQAAEELLAIESGEST